LWQPGGVEKGRFRAHILGMDLYQNRYHAIVSVDSPDGIHKRVSLKADSLEGAKELLSAQYRAAKIVSLWGEREAAAVRDK